MAMKQKELKSIGFLDIFKKSYKLIFSCPKIFIQITFLFILPISCINLANYLQLFPSPTINFSVFYKTQIGSPIYYNVSSETSFRSPTHYNNTFSETLVRSPSYYNNSYQTPMPMDSQNYHSKVANATTSSVGLKGTLQQLMKYFYLRVSGPSKYFGLHVSGHFSLPLRLVFLTPLKLLFSILYISSTTYTIACILTHNQKKITIQKAMCVIPEVWKQLLVTSISRSFMYFTITSIYILIITLGVILVTYSNPLGQLGICIGIIIVSSLFVGGIFYTCIIWLLADVVSVVEKICGIKALKKSNSLIKGKMGTTVAIHLVLCLCGLPNRIFAHRVQKNDVNIGEKICYGILTLVWPTMVSLLAIVVRVVLYFACKAHHQEEPIDWFPWVDYVEVSNLDYYLPLKVKEEQVEKL